LGKSLFSLAFLSLIPILPEMSRSTLQWAVLFWAMVWSASAQNTAGPPTAARAAESLVTTVQNEFYQVAGKSADEVRADMNQKRKGNYDAVTSWDIRWSFQARKEATGFNLQDVRVTVKITTLMPSWSGEGANRDDLLLWNRYIEALQEHEQEHSDNALKIARDIYEALNSQETKPTLTKAQSEGNNTGYRLLEKLRKLDGDFDSRTSHGATQGAVFP
jgi:predicted secreted Zn-dependent protease